VILVALHINGHGCLDAAISPGEAVSQVKRDENDLVRPHLGSALADQAGRRTAFLDRRVA
jgi:hypothetical protein